MTVVITNLMSVFCCCGCWWRAIIGRQRVCTADVMNL